MMSQGPLLFQFPPLIPLFKGGHQISWYDYANILMVDSRTAGRIHEDDL
jgi:hypothetical protein